ncbi:hypothetical protein Q7I24_16085, partial [Aeromonas veronii]
GSLSRYSKSTVRRHKRVSHFEVEFALHFAVHGKYPFILGSWEVPVENHPHVSILSELSGVATEIASFVNHFHVIYQKLDASHKISGFL